MDRIAERISEKIGSTPSLVLHFIWWLIWFIIGMDKELLVLIVSLEAILVTIFVLRAENVQSTRQEQFIKDDLKKSDEQIRKSNEQIRLLKKLIKGQK